MIIIYLNKHLKTLNPEHELNLKIMNNNINHFSDLDFNTKWLQYNIVHFYD